MRKLYLKIVAAIWFVMLASSVGVSLVANFVLPEERFRLRNLSPHDVFITLADRASAAARGHGEEGLVRWFEEHIVQHGPVLPLVLFNQQGDVLFGNRPPPKAPGFFSSDKGSGNGSANRPGDDSASGEQRVRQIEFMHDGERYRLISQAPPHHNLIRRNLLFALRVPSIWLLLMFAIPLSVILSFAIARYLVRPLRSIEQAGRRLSEGDLSARVGTALGNRGDEIADFAAAFDQMAARIERLVRTHKVLLRDVSHELRSPLARAHAALSLARQRTNGIVDGELERMEIEIERLDGMIGKLLAFSRLDSGERPMVREPVELVGLLTDIAEDAGFEAKADNKSVRLRDSEPRTVNGDAELLASCFENVIRNALRHTHPNTAVDISIGCDRSASRHCRVDVRDHGDGVPDDQLEQIFEPFHRVENGSDWNNGRSGIGLAIARRAVNLHGGTISAANAPDGGLVVTVSLPVESVD